MLTLGSVLGSVHSATSGADSHSEHDDGPIAEEIKDAESVRKSPSRAPSVQDDEKMTMV